MAKKKRIQKSRDQRVDDCETHLYVLWDALRQYPQERDRYKQSATESLILVCDKMRGRRLLLALMEEIGFSYDVQPSGPPRDKQPITMIRWKDDPEYRNMANELQEANMDKQKLDELLEKQVALRRPVPFPEFVEGALAVYIKPYDYSYCQLVRAVAQQMGGTHEDTAVDEPLVRLSQYIIGGNEGHVAPLIGFTKLVIKVGSRFIASAAEIYGYEPRYFKDAGQSLTGADVDDSNKTK